MNNSNEFNYNKIYLRKKFLHYLLPSVAAMWVFSIYTMVDGIFVSKGVGSNALAAVNISMPFVNFIFAISMLFSTGVSTIIAIYLGKKNYKKANQVFSFNMVCMILCSIFILIMGFLNIKKLALFLGATETTLPLVISYLKIIILFNGFFIISYCLEVLTKTDGFPYLAIIGMIIAAGTNIILDYIVVIKLNWGIKGAALATGFSQMVSCFFFLKHFLSSNSKIKFTKFKISLKTLKRILSIGFPDAITELTSGIVILMFNQSILKYIGENGIITYSVITYINTLVLMTMIGITQGMQPLSSYYYGKEDSKTVLNLLKMSFKTVAIVSTFSFLISILFTKNIVSIFISSSDINLFKYTVDSFRKFSISFLILGFNILISGFCASVEKPFNATIISISRGLIIILLVLFSMVAIFGGEAIWYVTIISETICLIISLVVLKNTID
ncbi:MATE family efflux transporter [Clostridium tarantellae]|uniref:Multidrug export protein MepA n=1 Tax=Clostridium tarantellae TaxID=39493 RepID=A0A6I1ML48_9CLOT|nr:MATE family efflux transporter [Clostridium tarantellae]MPQ44226.1 MATE family efflux transporter [Clostridium tarantellae]